MSIESALIAAVAAEAAVIGALWIELRRVQASRAKERAAEADRYERLVGRALDSEEHAR